VQERQSVPPVVEEVGSEIVALKTSLRGRVNEPLHVRSENLISSRFQVIGTAV
jgi:hypothetical protein